MKARAAGEMPLVEQALSPRKKGKWKTKNFAQGEMEKGKRDPVYPNQWNRTVRRIPKNPIESLRWPSTPPPKANKEHSDESLENIYLFA